LYENIFRVLALLALDCLCSRFTFTTRQRYVIILVYLPMVLNMRCIVDGMRTARVWFISGHALSEFLKMNPMLFMTPLTKMLQSRPTRVEMTATPSAELAQTKFISVQDVYPGQWLTPNKTHLNQPPLLIKECFWGQFLKLEFSELPSTQKRIETHHLWFHVTLKKMLLCTSIFAGFSLLTVNIYTLFNYYIYNIFHNNLSL